MTQGFVNVIGTARKFYTIVVGKNNPTVTLFWGRLGTAGQSKRLVFTNRADLQDYVERRVDSKLAKGYVQIA